MSKVEYATQFLDQSMIKKSHVKNVLYVGASSHHHQSNHNQIITPSIGAIHICIDLGQSSIA